MRKTRRWISKDFHVPRLSRASIRFGNLTKGGCASPPSINIFDFKRNVSQPELSGLSILLLLFFDENVRELYSEVGGRSQNVTSEKKKSYY